MCIFDELLKVVQQAKEAAESNPVPNRHDEKAILARAFRGELGTNNSAEPSALQWFK